MSPDAGAPSPNAGAPSSSALFPGAGALSSDIGPFLSIGTLFPGILLSACAPPPASFHPLSILSSLFHVLPSVFVWRTLFLDAVHLLFLSVVFVATLSMQTKSEF